MPGERGPMKVPMMPLADMVALSTSVSNHSSKKSAELMVMSFVKIIEQFLAEMAKMIAHRGKSE